MLGHDEVAGDFLVVTVAGLFLDFEDGFLGFGGG